jgi:hypothetical protein
MSRESELYAEIEAIIEKKRNAEYTTKEEKKLLSDALEAKRLELQEIIVAGE